MSESDDSMSEIDEQEQNHSNGVGGGIPDYIMNLDNIPAKLPTHLELHKSRVICNIDAPQHTDPINYSGAYAALGV
ncbi:DNA-directed RNA polymerases I and III subunit RPAC1-like, partial [Trifolium medium]|nr:DNA-directed RNA polymerases I and III subunit RPAC1-like [Trifolium medium]